MNILSLINSYIKYVYILLVVIILLCIIVLFSNLAKMSKDLVHINKTKESIDNASNIINEKLDKVQYTIDYSLPLFGVILFVYLIIRNTIKDYKHTIKGKRNIAKSTLRQYRKLNKVYKFSSFTNNASKVISEIRKLA